jgi:hypothetical protein
VPHDVFQYKTTYSVAKRFLFIVSLLSVFIAQAQIPVQYVGTTNNRVIIRNQGRADSAWGLPNLKTTTNLMSGQLAYNKDFRGLEVYDTATARWYQIGSLQLRDGVISGGNVSWTGTGLNFYVSESVYVIGGLLYFGNDTTVTLAASDPTDPRLDVIGLDAAGVITLTGTPAADPAKPQVTPGSELELTSILVAAGATTPTGITQEVIYDENTEWTVTTSNLTANADNTTFPYRLTKSVDVDAYTALTGRSLIFTKGSLVDMTQYSLLTLYVRLNADYANNATIGVRFTSSATTNFRSSNTVTISTGNYNFVRTNDAVYQTIQIPMSAFTFSSVNFNTSPTSLNRLTLTFNGAADGLYVDYINLQGGVTIPSAGVTTFNNRGGNVTPIKDDYDQWFCDTSYRRADSVFCLKNGVELFQYKDSVGSGGGSSLTFSNGTKESAGTVTAGGAFDTDSISYISNSSKVFRIQSRTAAGTVNLSDVLLSPTTSYTKVIGASSNIFTSSTLTSAQIEYKSTQSDGTTTDILIAPAGISLRRYGVAVSRMLNVGSTINFSNSAGSIISNVFGADSSIHYKKLSYGGNYRSLFNQYNLVDKGYVDSLAGTISGSTVLNNVGTGYDVAVQGTDNVKRLQAGWGIDLDSATTNVVKIIADTAQLATVTAVRDTAAALRYLYSGESVAWGTYAERVALTPTNGQRFFQTNERIGEWVYGNSRWYYQNNDVVFDFTPYRSLASQFATGAGSGGGTSLTIADSAYGAGAYVSTGTTVGGNAYFVGANNFQNYDPIYSATADSNNIYIIHFRAKIDGLSIANDARAWWGFANYGSTVVNDSAGANIAVFRWAEYRGGNLLITARNTGGTELYNANGPSLASLAGKFNDYVIVYNNKSYEFWVNGTKYMHVLFVGATLPWNNPFVSIQKVNGASQSAVHISTLRIYRARKI